ncbi:MAG: beta-phosphoglucomutase [Bacteroidetes bacterium GWC2_33_15]|nr:MAG: beta-phosphoglucomutase [Bacteroidetes bacterium GWA2_33_15]OFX49100.1 MAG: beta-phosphoglucomutase [Bacteroidetes bacterium GWC2_33_15]OFX64868.1 MAG: beta-phosphoglucomutase [Bacteroidetes bacterium GWB2_32_14]OFX68576.1 MAG: beta-phosphoglucomutase [Bacteroidetes bacterium GWD2_33_33]HAN17422.1 beta-phosphoglucomutase [Bacteroidales bacterium]
MKKIDAVIFDLDGVIVDTAVFHYQAWKRLAHELGFDLTPEQNEHLKGVSRIESLEIVLEIGRINHLTQKKKEEIATKKNDWYRENILKMTPDDILPGVSDFLGKLKKANYKIAIGSSSKNAGTILERIGYSSYFDAVVDGTKINYSKPDPEVFIKAANLLKANPKNCIVFEDAAAGIEAANNAGMKSIGVGSPDVLYKANIVIPDLRNLDISIFDNLIEH